MTTRLVRSPLCSLLFTPTPTHIYPRPLSSRLPLPLYPFLSYGALSTRSHSYSPPLPIPRISYPPPSSSPVDINDPTDAPLPLPHGPKVDSYFGCNVFDSRRVKEFVTGQNFVKYLDCVSKGKPIDVDLADVIANALLKWATERGVTHFTHWFQPVNGSTAEKHDTFVDTMKDGTPLIRFTGKQITLSEPDGSSFPSGGLRATHIARGYTTWDPSSPPFIMENSNGATLYIPSCFFSWDRSRALDEKIPLLRSEVALSREALRLFDVMGPHKHTRVHMDSGLEQEFFLIDRKYYLARPDLVAAGRTVIGCCPPKGQELEDQYFGAISTRFLDCLHEFEVECWKLGIPLQTRHREVAPGQYEIAPKFAPANIGTDRNLILMEVLRKVARKHNLAALLHEKPFATVNGSGKHNNWSLGTNEIPSLLTPGPKPENNSLFMLFLAATIRAIDKNADLMRISIAGAGNDHRLGANEAPPAIVSVYLGEDIKAAVERFIKGDKSSPPFDSVVNLGFPLLPLNLHRVPTDRNRTSTFAFTGNKFEFRAVGSSHNPSRSNQVLNTIVAESVRYMADEIEKLKKAGNTSEQAVHKVTSKVLEQHQRVCWEGNGYAQEWQDEAARRGLPNYKSTPSALDTLYTPKNIELFDAMRVLDEEELRARSNIMFEDYIKRICIEAKVQCSMCKQSILPVALDYLKRVYDTAESTGVNVLSLVNELKSTIQKMVQNTDELEAALHRVHKEGSLSASAHFCEDVLIPSMTSVRQAADALEQILPAKDWPFPSFMKMLFDQD